MVLCTQQQQQQQQQQHLLPRPQALCRHCCSAPKPRDSNALKLRSPRPTIPASVGPPNTHKRHLVPTHLQRGQTRKWLHGGTDGEPSPDVAGQHRPGAITWQSAKPQHRHKKTQIHHHTYNGEDDCVVVRAEQSLVASFAMSRKDTYPTLPSAHWTRA